MAEQDEEKAAQEEPASSPPPAAEDTRAKPPQPSEPQDADKAPPAEGEAEGAEAGRAPEPPRPEKKAEPEVRPRPLPPGEPYIWGTGRRKKAVARVRIRPGSGRFLVNKRDASEYFQHERDRLAIVSPLQATRMMHGWDVWVNVNGGGYGGQAGAVVLGLARALAKAMPDCEGVLRDQGLLTRDARMRERKKPGQPGARKRFQFSKR